MWAEMYHMAGPGSLDDQDMVRLARYDQIKATYRACEKFARDGLKGLSADESRIVLEIAEMELGHA